MDLAGGTVIHGALFKLHEMYDVDAAETATCRRQSDSEKGDPGPLGRVRCASRDQSGTCAQRANCAF